MATGQDGQGYRRRQRPGIATEGLVEPEALMLTFQLVPEEEGHGRPPR